MASKSQDIHGSGDLSKASNSTLYSKDSLSAKSKCAIIAFTVGGVAGVIIVALGGMNIFGAVGSIGFIASMAGGGVLACISIGGVIWIVVANCKSQKRTVQPNNILPHTDSQQNNTYTSVSSSTKKSDTTPPTSQSKNPSSKPQVQNSSVPILSKASTSVSSSTKNPDIIPHTPQSINSSSKPQIQKNSSAPILSNEKRKYDEQRDRFRSAIKERTEKKAIAPFELADSHEMGFEEAAKEAFGHFYREMPPESPIKTFGGGEHVCVTTAKIPGVLFKQRRGSSSTDMNNYMQKAVKARKICEENNLHLLHVPKCHVVDFKPSVVMEEKVELLDGGWESQRACYQWAVQDPQLQPYIKEVLRQLTIFICLMGLADTKYDNIPLMRDGRVALFDLDESGAVTGLTSGCANGKDGLFNILPLEWFDEFIEIAKQNLKPQDFEELQKRLPKLREKAQKRHERTKKIGAFYNTHNITLPTQPLVFDKKLFKGYKPEVALFAERAIQHLNQQISPLPHLSMVVGRKISIGTNIGTEFFKAIVEDSFFSSKKIWHKEFKEIEKEGLKALQEQGYIFSYKISRYYPFFSVVC